MAKQSEINKKATFFAYTINNDNKVKYIDNCQVGVRARWELVRDPNTLRMVPDDELLHIINFTAGIYATEDPDEIEYLRAYNTGWEIVFSDGRKVRIKATPFPTISESVPFEWKKWESKVEIKEVEVKIIPESIVEIISLDQLIDMVKTEFKIKDFAPETKEDAVKILKEKGLVK